MKKRFSHASVKLDRDVSWCMLRAYNYVCGSYKYGDSTKLCHTHLMLCDLEILLSFTYWIVTSFSNLYGIGTSCTHGSFLQCSQTYNMRVCVCVSVSMCLCLCVCVYVCVCVLIRGRTGSVLRRSLLATARSQNILYSVTSHFLQLVSESANNTFEGRIPWIYQEGWCGCISCYRVCIVLNENAK